MAALVASPMSSLSPCDSSPSSSSSTSSPIFSPASSASSSHTSSPPLTTTRRPPFILGYPPPKRNRSVTSTVPPVNTTLSTPNTRVPGGWNLEFSGFVKYIKWPAKERDLTGSTIRNRRLTRTSSVSAKIDVVSLSQEQEQVPPLIRNSSNSSSLAASLSSNENLATSPVFDFPPKDSASPRHTSLSLRCPAKRKPLFSLSYATSPTGSEPGHPLSTSLDTGKLRRAFSLLSSRRPTLPPLSDPPAPPVFGHRRSYSANVIHPSSLNRRGGTPKHVCLSNVPAFEPTLSPLPSPSPPINTPFVLPEPILSVELERRPSHRKWSLHIAESENVDDQVLLAELERLRQLGEPTDLLGEQRWGLARMALLCSREVIRTEKSYLRRLRKLQDENMAIPELLKTHLPFLISASELFSHKLDEDPSAYGVSVAFLAAEDVIERALVEWSKVVGEVMVSFLGSGSGDGGSDSASGGRRWKLSLTRLGKENGVEALPPLSPSNLRDPLLASPSPTSPGRKMLAVQDIAIQPTQRVVQYVLLYQDLLRHTPQTSPSRALIERALHGALRIARRCDTVQNNPKLSVVKSSRRQTN